MQFGLLPCLMWPLTLHEVPISKVEKLERLVSSYAKKWLGLPRCFSSIGLYGKGILDLLISSLTEEDKCGDDAAGFKRSSHSSSRPKAGSWMEVNPISGRRTCKSCTQTSGHCGPCAAWERWSWTALQLGTRPLHPKDASLWCRKCDGKRRQSGENPRCRLCPMPATLKHILMGCKTSLAQG